MTKNRCFDNGANQQTSSFPTYTDEWSRACASMAVFSEMYFGRENALRAADDLR